MFFIIDKIKILVVLIDNICLKYWDIKKLFFEVELFIKRIFCIIIIMFMFF